MTREVFVEKLGMLLDLLANSNNERLLVYGCGTANDVNFKILCGELYSFNLLFCVNSETLLSMKDVHKQDILDMFTDIAVAGIDILNIQVTD